MLTAGTISRVAGPFLLAKGMAGSRMYELVRVGEADVIGEIIRLEGETAAIQAYEETAGIKPGEKVVGTGKPLSVELGPGLIGQIYDGIQRPLPVIQDLVGPRIRRGVTPPALDRKKRWHFQQWFHEYDETIEPWLEQFSSVFESLMRILALLRVTMRL